VLIKGGGVGVGVGVGVGGFFVKFKERFEAFGELRFEIKEAMKEVERGVGVIKIREIKIIIIEPFKEREELKMLSRKFVRKIIRKERRMRSKRIFERKVVVVVVVVIVRHLKVGVCVYVCM